jgi:hypothetical protein
MEPKPGRVRKHRYDIILNHQFTLIWIGKTNLTIFGKEFFSAIGRQWGSHFKFYYLSD